MSPIVTVLSQLVPQTSSGRFKNILKRYVHTLIQSFVVKYSFLEGATSQKSGDLILTPTKLNENWWGLKIAVTLSGIAKEPIYFMKIFPVIYLFWYYYMLS